MRSHQPPLFYVKVWDRFPDEKGAKIHPHFEGYHAYPVLRITGVLGSPIELFVPDDRLHFRYALADHCTLADDSLMWAKNQTSN